MNETRNTLVCEVKGRRPRPYSRVGHTVSKLGQAKKQNVNKQSVRYLSKVPVQMLRELCSARKAVGGQAASEPALKSNWIRIRMDQFKTQCPPAAVPGLSLGY